MIVLLLVTTVLLSVSTGYFAYRQLTDRSWQRRAERARADREIRRAERKLHDIASNTFTSMMSAARSWSGNREWRR